MSAPFFFYTFLSILFFFLVFKTWELYRGAMIKEEWRTKFDHTCQTYAQHIYREMQKKIQKLFRIIVMSARYIYYRLGIEIHTFVEKLLTLWLESLRKRSIVHRHTESSYLRDISEHKDGLHKTLE